MVSYEHIYKWFDLTIGQAQPIAKQTDQPTCIQSSIRLLMNLHWGVKEGHETIIIQPHDLFPSFGTIFSSKDNWQHCKYFTVFYVTKRKFETDFCTNKHKRSFLNKTNKTFILYRYTESWVTAPADLVWTFLLLWFTSSTGCCVSLW